MAEISLLGEKIKSWRRKTLEELVEIKMIKVKRF
ncbi:hypothetical protein JCM16776_1697 [Leptotrichia shahii]|uniref:Uncharacterized protein n=1 Tax=Leptotrichia shahii TaxID=157691 RepID=A0A510JSR2_9FUSO|nr:hypothetical protein JCM16776_1697 [Leptotrichia shahii]